MLEIVSFPLHLNGTTLVYLGVFSDVLNNTINFEEITLVFYTILIDMFVSLFLDGNLEGAQIVTQIFIKKCGLPNLPSGFFILKVLHN